MTETREAADTAASDRARLARMFLWLGIAAVGFQLLGHVAPIARYVAGSRVSATVVGHRSVNYASGGNRSSMCERTYRPTMSEETLTIDGPCLLLTGEPAVGSSATLGLSGDGKRGATHIEAFGIGLSEGFSLVLLAGALVFHRRTQRV